MQSILHLILLNGGRGLPLLYPRQTSLLRYGEPVLFLIKGVPVQDFSGFLGQKVKL